MEFAIVLTILLLCVSAVLTINDVGVDTLLVKEYHDRFLNQTATKPFDANYTWFEVIYYVDPQIYLLFKYLTVLWIASGGTIQSVVIIFLLIRQDPNIQLLPKPVRILVLVTAPLLMGPVVVNLYAAGFVFHNANKDNIQADVTK